MQTKDDVVESALTSQEKDQLAAKRATQSVLIALLMCVGVLGTIWALFNYLGGWAIVAIIVFFALASLWNSAYEHERKKLK